MDDLFKRLEADKQRLFGLGLKRMADDIAEAQTEITEKDETIAELERCSVAQIAKQQEEIERLKEMSRELVRLNGMNV